MPRAASAMSIGALLFAVAANGCAAPADDADGVAEAQLGGAGASDLEYPLLETLAHPPPPSLSEVQHWSVTHVRAGGNADEAFDGIAMYAKDLTQAPRYLVTLRLGASRSELTFLRIVEEPGSPPLELSSAAGPQSPELAWLGGEAARLLDELRSVVRFGGGGDLRPSALTPEHEDALACVAKVSVFALTTVATLGTGFAAALAVQGAADLLFAEWSKASLELAAAGALHGTSKILAKRGLDKTARRLGAAGLVGLGAMFVYELGTQTSVRAAMETVVPEACMATYDRLRRDR